MKKWMLGLLMLLLGVSYLFANTVTEATAKKVGLNFLASKVSSTNLIAVKDMKLAYKQTNASAVTSFYVFNATGAKGFVIVAADDNCSPILGYSDESNFDPANIPIQLKEMLQGYTNQINYVIANNKVASLNIKNTWQQLIVPQVNPLAKAPGAPVLRTPLIQTLWDQFPYYNNLCPNDNGIAERTVTGCVATAMAQVMKFWNYPLHGTGSNSYTPSTNSYLGIQSANFATTTYDWANMPLSLSATSTTAQQTAIATLMYHSGVSVNMDYGVASNGGSAAYAISYNGGVAYSAETALKNNFGYNSGLKGIIRSNYTDATWISLIEKEIDSARPVIYSGTGGQGGHCFIADAYDANDLFHFNWGWSGWDNGFFAISALNPGMDTFNLGQTAIIGVKPAGLSSPTISSFTPASADSGVTVTITGTNFTGVTAVTFGGISAASFIVNSTTSISAVVNNGSSGNVSVITAGGAANKAGFSYAPAYPYVSLFTPTTGGAKTIVTITGHGFKNVSIVYIAGEPVKSFTVNSSTSVTAVVDSTWPSTSRNSTVCVILANGNGSCGQYPFTYLENTVPAVQLYSAITASPSQLIQGQLDSISFNLANVQPTTFNGAYRLRLYNNNSQQNVITWSGPYTLQSGNSYNGNWWAKEYITVPPGTYSLAVEDSTSGGNWVFAGAGAYTNPITVTVLKSPLSPSITSFTPASGVTGTTITITGSNFTNVTGVTIGSIPAVYTVNSATSIDAVVGYGQTGSVCVTTANGSDCKAGFTYIIATNTAPTFVNSNPQAFAICQNASATSINSLLTITDPDASQTETYSVTGNPLHGSITAGTTVGSGTGVSPTGWSYTPANGYSGTDAFTIQVSDGTATAGTTVNVTVKANSASTIDTTVCEGALPYTWRGYSFNAAGTHLYHTTNAAGCDSSVTLNMAVKANGVSQNDTAICSGAFPFNWRGHTFNVAGLHDYGFINSYGCDSIAHFNITVKAGSSATTNLTINSSQLPYSWNGLTFNAAGSQTAHLTNAAGCDSAAILNLTVKALALTIGTNGSNPSFTQGTPFSYTISGLDAGTSVMNEMWIDIDSNGIINPAIDVLFVGFPQTDGQLSNQGPGDDDGVANGAITTSINGLYFPLGHYIFKTSTSTDIAYATFIISPLSTPTFSVSGKVIKGANGLANVVVEIWSQNEQIFTITNAAGDYLFKTDLSSGTAIELSVPNDGSFNSSILSGLLVTPNKLSTTLTANITGADFAISAGKFIMGRVIDGQGNPIAGMEVNASIQNQNGSGYRANTDGNGMYIISLQPGDYQVIFGSYNSPKGYLLTAYNQQYTNGNINLVHVSSNVDTVKNIDAILYKGALITGTMMNNGSPVQGNISAIDYNNPSAPVYQSSYDGNTGLYYLYVLPGTYSIYFQQNNGNNNGVYYNQSGARPGTAVVVNSINDHISNINVDFGTVPSCATSSVTNISVCQNQLPFNWNGQNFGGDGTFMVHMMNAGGCDSAATLNLSIKAGTLSTTNMSICASALPYYWNGLTFYGTSIQTAHLNNAGGCDSAATLNLMVKTSSASFTNMSVCASSLPYNWNGLTFYGTSTQTAHLQNSVNCDSAATLNLTVNTSSVSTTNTTISSSALPYVWNGLTFNVAGTQTAHLSNSVVGCDSAATLNLTLNSGITGNGLSFDGVNDNVSIGNPAALQFDSTSSFTIEAWLKPNTANSSSWNAVIDKSYYGSQKGFLIYNGGGTLIVANVNGFATVGSTSLPYNVWTHIAVSYNNGTWKLYKNGILKSTATNKLYKDASSPVTIGMRTDNLGSGLTDAYAGLMDEVRFWNIEKTAAAIQSNMNCDVAQQAGLVAYYRFDQGAASGTNTGLNYANDYSGNGNCGTLNNFALSGDTSNWVMGTISSCNSINVNCAPNYVWTGATSTNWSVASNWSNNVLPTTGVTVNIPSAPTNQPVLSADVSISGMIVNGSVGINGHLLTINGAVSGTGKIKGSATSSLMVNSSSNNTLYFGTSATDSMLANLTVSGTGTLTLGSGLGLTNLLTVSAGTLATGNHLTLKSTSIANTAVVGPVGGTVTGNVTVERFIPKHIKSYQSLTTGGVYNAGSIFKNWQEGGVNTNSYGIFVTGKKGTVAGVDATTGLDVSPAGNISMYNYTNYLVYTPVTNTKNTNLDPYTGYLTVVYGNRALPLIPSNVFDASANMNAAATIRTTGTLVTGTVTFDTAGVKGTLGSNFNSAVTRILPSHDTGTFIANPYSCAIDWNNLSRTNLNNTYYYYEPTYLTSGYQAFVCFNSITGSNNPNKSKINRYIQPGQGFWVQTDNTVSKVNRILVINESNKVTNQPFTAVFGTGAAGINRLVMTMWKNGENIDGAVAAFDNNFTTSYGDEDSKKMFGNGPSLYITEGLNNLSIDGIPIPAVNDRIALQMSGLTKDSVYEFHLDAQEFNSNGLTAYLEDAVGNTETVVGTASTEYSFTAKSASENRFTVVFKPGALPVHFVTVKAKAVEKKINAISWTVSDEVNIARYEVEQSFTGKDFVKIASVKAAGIATYTALDNVVKAGTIYYRIKAIDNSGKEIYSNVVTVVPVNLPGSIVVTPNPVRGNTVGLRLNNLDKGNYVIGLYNTAGQQIYTKEMAIDGNATIEIPITNSIANGLYNVSVKGVNSYKTEVMIQR